MLFGVETHKVLILMSKNASMLAGKHQLALNSPNLLGLELRGQKSGCLGWLPQVGGSSTFGWLSAGSLQLQLVEKKSIPSTSKDKVEWFLNVFFLNSFYEPFVRKYLGLNME